MIDTRTIPEIDQGKMPIWQLDEIGMSELAWRDRTLRRGDRSRLPQSVIRALRIADEPAELFRKAYLDLITPALTPEMLLETGVVRNLKIFEYLEEEMPLSDKFAKQSLTDMLCYNLLVNASRAKAGEEKRCLIRLGFNLADWPSKLPALKLKATDLTDPDEVVGVMYDEILISDFSLGFDYRELQRVLAKKWPWTLCADCGSTEQCKCAEIKDRERTGHFKIDVVVDEWQACQQSLYGLAIQMQDQYHAKNQGRGTSYELERVKRERTEFANRVLNYDHSVRKNLNLPELMEEATDLRIWITVMSLPLKLNLYEFLFSRYTRMAKKRLEEQRELGERWEWSGSVWQQK